MPEDVQMKIIFWNLSRFYITQLPVDNSSTEFDFRKVNKIIEKNRNATPFISSIIDRLRNDWYIKYNDINCSVWSIPFVNPLEKWHLFWSLVVNSINLN